MRLAVMVVLVGRLVGKNGQRKIKIAHLIKPVKSRAGRLWWAKWARN